MATIIERKDIEVRGKALSMALLVVLVVSTLGDRAVGQRPWRLDKAFAADSPPRRPHADRSQSRYIHPVPSSLSAFPPVSFSFYLLPEALCLLVSTHPLKLSFEETSFRETVWTFCVYSSSNQVLPHSLSCLFTGQWARWQEHGT